MFSHPRRRNDPQDRREDTGRGDYRRDYEHRKRSDNYRVRGDYRREDDYRKREDYDSYRRRNFSPRNRDYYRSRRRDEPDTYRAERTESYDRRSRDIPHRQRSYDGRSDPTRRRSRSPPRSVSSRSASSRPPSSSGSDPSRSPQTFDVGSMDEEELVMKMMGFGQFDTTKNKDHLESDAYGVNKRSKRKYRQYMNRKGGFNRPLSPTY